MLTRRIQQAGLLLLLTGTLAGCGASRPVKYYALDPGPTPANPASAPSSLRILVARVTAPQLYRDDRLVFGSGPVELGTYEYERWSAPPADMLQDALVASLRASGAYSSVSRVASKVPGDYIVRGHLYALDEVEKPELAARFTFQLELFDPRAGTTIWSDSYTHDEPVSGKKPTVADVVEALDSSVHAGLAQLTSELNQYFVSHPPQAR